MAGGKETPRQKMIGLMYLVLTAMLALNVDSAVLERFVQINEILVQQVNKSGSENNRTLGDIDANVKERGNKAEEVKIFETAKTVRSRTSELLTYIDDIKTQAVETSGGYENEKARTLKGGKDMDVFANMMIRKKQGDELKSKIDSYCSYLGQITSKPDDFKTFALDGEDDPYFSAVKNQREKNFSQLYFESTPLAGGLASLSQMQSKIMDYETEALDFLAGQVGATDVRFDNIVPLVVPESRYVAAGARFKAQMYAAASASNVSPTMTWGGQSIKVDEHGIGAIDFKASGGKYDKDNRLSKTVKTKININGKDYEQEYEYFVIKPTIQIQSASVQALYLNCGNELFVNVPALGADYNPSFKGTGGQALKGNAKNKVMCVPTGKKFTLGVYNDGSLIGNETFNVRRIPKPDIQMKGDGSAIDEKKGVTKPPRTISMAAIPDDDFKTFLPKDARYRVTKWEIIWARGSRALDRKEVSSQNFNLPSGWRQARPGDRIVIEVKEVQRRNFQNKNEKVIIPSGSRIKQIPIN